MKISIKHIDNTFNYGSCMMAITLINSINTNIDDVEFYVDSYKDKDVERLKSETNVEKIFRDNVDGSSNIIKKCVNKVRRIKLNRFIDKIDLVIIIGGDDISEYYTIGRLENELNRIAKQSKKKKLILLGQTMGPFTGRRIAMAKDCLKGTSIYTRDDKNFEYLKKIGFENLTKGRDLAFADLPMQHKRKNILKKYNLKNNEYITIVLSGLTKCYTKNRDEYIKNQVEIVKRILCDDKILDKKIVLLPHVLLPEDVDDRIVIEEVVSKLSTKDRKRIIEIKDEMLPSEAREILGNGMFTITGRMHAAVSTFYMRKPAISLSYSIKYAGVIGDGLNMNELVIESSDEALWSSGKICEMVAEKVNYLMNNYEEIIEEINISVEDTSKIVKKQLENVIQQIKEYKTDNIHSC